MNFCSHINYLTQLFLVLQISAGTDASFYIKEILFMYFLVFRIQLLTQLSCVLLKCIEVFHQEHRKRCFHGFFSGRPGAMMWITAENHVKDNSNDE